VGEDCDVLDNIIRQRSRWRRGTRRFFCSEQATSRRPSSITWRETNTLASLSVRR